MAGCDSDEESISVSIAPARSLGFNRFERSCSVAHKEVGSSWGSNGRYQPYQRFGCQQLRKKGMLDSLFKKWILIAGIDQ
jgi:hypothetical protein